LTDQFNVAFFSFIWSSYDSGVQSTYALPIWLGIVPTALQTTVRQKLLADIDANGHHLTTGILGTKYLIDTLGDRMNRVDAAVSLIFQSTYPSWLYEIVQTVEASAVRQASDVNLFSIELPND
jgi:alpha-L-rhamnosidase